MRIAVATSDTVHVNEHFGRADRFLIYDLVGPTPRYIETRPVTRLSTGDPDHPFDPARLAAIVQVLADCSRVYVTAIGERPAAELAARGITPVLYEGAIATLA
ncbi:MAG: NifB/NifX family molybdenum-iron cluster-binding protein [Thermodesulfobacteriota bacterium]